MTIIGKYAIEFNGSSTHVLGPISEETPTFVYKALGQRDGEPRALRYRKDGLTFFDSADEAQAALKRFMAVWDEKTQAVYEAYEAYENAYNDRTKAAMDAMRGNLG